MRVKFYWFLRNRAKKLIHKDKFLVEKSKLFMKYGYKRRAMLNIRWTSIHGTISTWIIKYLKRSLDKDEQRAS